MASDSMPLPIPAQPVTSFEGQLDRLRAVHSQAISDIVDRCCAELLLPDHQAMLCLDVAQFTTFLMAVKLTEIRGQQPEREHLMAAYWPMQKALKDEVPGMLREFAVASAGRP